MRPLTRDPAPSRAAYRLQRLWLTPAVRLLLRFGVPAVLVFVTAGLWLRDEGNRDRIIAQVAEIRSSIEERPEFMVNVMAIDGASEDVSLAIREILPIEFPISSFDLELEEMRQQIQTLDAVAGAEVRIRSGGVLQIDIEERQPAVVWRRPGAISLLDADGNRVADVDRRSERSDLPLIAGLGADAHVPEALALLHAARPIMWRMRGIVRVGERRWDVVLADGARIQLPEEGAVPALERVIALDQAKDLLGRDITVVDLRNPSRPTVRLSEAAVTERHLIRRMSLGVQE